jgi:WS/DGAT/MGAT family acyltransferase
MAYSHYERLSALDATFLTIESPSVHMHVGSVAILEGAPLRTAEGGLDLERIRGLSAPVLQRSPRFRQRLERIPGFGHFVWVDDPRFNLDYHLRHTSLPEPGDARQLKRLAGRIFSQKLDLRRPPWEMWLVEGLEDGRFAVISKLHHCMIDGVSGAELLASFMAEGSEAGAAPARWLPRPAPTGARLFADELARRAALPARVAAAGLRGLGAPLRTLGEARHALEAVGHVLAAGLRSASSTPLDVEIGPYRRFDWTRMDLAAVREVKGRLGGTVNDVVLAIFAGAMRHFLERRAVAVDELEFRAMLPVSVRRRGERAKLGNRVASLVARLPVDEASAAERYRRVVAETGRQKASDLVEGGELLEELADRTVFAFLSRLVSRARAGSVVVTNVPGPQIPLGLFGARMEEVYPLVPLFTNQALGVALLSYDGSLFWGFDADWDALPDLHELVDLVQEEFEALRKLEARSAP